MTHYASYETDGTSALKPAEQPRLRLYRGGGRGAMTAQAGPHRSHLRALLAAAALMIAIVVGVCLTDDARDAAAWAKFDAAPHEVAYVRAGDSLWSIAERQGGGTADTARLVCWIQEANGLSGATIFAGEALVVPVLGQ